MAQEIVLARHGQTEWSRSGQHTGRTDIPLTDEGCEQAKRIGPALGDRQFTAVWTSPLARASETCRLAGFDAVAVRKDELMEWDYGDYEGRKTIDIRKEVPGWTLWRDGVPGGETAEQVTGRLDRLLEEVRALDGDALFFAHGHILRALTARWLGLPVTDGRLFALDTATISILGHERETEVIRSWNQPIQAG